MKKWFIHIPIQHRGAFLLNIHLESLSRVRSVLIILALFQAIQALIYVMNTKSILHDPFLIYLKLFIVLFSLLSYFLLYYFQKHSTRYERVTEAVLCTIVSITLLWSVINTFKAQSITSDISIYLLVLFAVAAVIRIRPWITAIIFGGNYTVFLIGMPNFQTNRDYLISHIMNGLILNVIAYLISRMMYAYSLNDYIDKQDIGKKNVELLHMARHDGLTSLYNHQAIHEMLEASIIWAKESSRELSVLLIDLDYFKEINDVLGHRAGDNALRLIAERILCNIRQGDIAGRYGGDEFLVILPGSDLGRAKGIASRLLNDIRELKYEGIQLSFSCGIALWHGQRADQLIDEADKALYRVKNDGRNNIYA